MRLAGYARRRQICNMIPLTIVYVQLVQICRVFSNEIQNHFQLWCNNGLTRDKQKGKLRFIITWIADGDKFATEKETSPFQLGGRGVARIVCGIAQIGLNANKRLRFHFHLSCLVLSCLFLSYKYAWRALCHLQEIKAVKAIANRSNQMTTFVVINATTPAHSLFVERLKDFTLICTRPHNTNIL